MNKEIERKIRVFNAELSIKLTTRQNEAIRKWTDDLNAFCTDIKNSIDEIEKGTFDSKKYPAIERFITRLAMLQSICDDIEKDL